MEISGSEGKPCSKCGNSSKDDRLMSCRDEDETETNCGICDICDLKSLCYNCWSDAVDASLKKVSFTTRLFWLMSTNFDDW